MGPIHIAFELTIYAGLILSATTAFFLYKKIQAGSSFFKKHTVVTHTMLVGSLLCFLLLFWGSFIESRRVATKHESLDITHLTNPIKIVLIADFQVGPYKRTGFVKRIARMAHRLEPDIVLLAGDHIDNSGSNFNELSFLSPLEELAAEYPTFAVHGNHEYGLVTRDKPSPFPDLSSDTKKALEKLGVHYLVNELEHVKINDSSLYIYGTDAWWSGNTDFSGLDARTENIPTIILNHNPAAVTAASEYNADLIVSGHTHGGQIRFPLVGALSRTDYALPLEWDRGWYEYNGLKGFTTVGVGESGTRARLFNPPEIVVFEMY